MLSGMEAASYLTSTVREMNSRLKGSGSPSRQQQQQQQQQQRQQQQQQLTDAQLLAQVKRRERAASGKRRGGGGGGGGGKTTRAVRSAPHKGAPQAHTKWDLVRDTLHAKGAMEGGGAERGEFEMGNGSAKGRARANKKPVPAIVQWRARKAKDPSLCDTGSLLGTQILERLDKLDAEDALKVPDGVAWDGGRLMDGRKPMVQLTGDDGGVSTASRAFSYLVNQPFSQISDHRFVGAASPAHAVPKQPLPPPPSRTTTPRLGAAASPSAALESSKRRAFTLALAGSKSLDRVLYKALCE